LLSTFQSDGWKLILTLADEEMFSALDGIYTIPVGDPNISFKYAYLKGQIDFIRSIYILEAMVMAGDVEEQVEIREQKIAAKFRALYRRLIFWRQ